MKTLHLLILCLALVGIGFGLFVYKFSYLGFPLSPDRVVDVWDVEAKISFEGKSKPVKVILQIPQSDNQFIVASEHFVSGRFGLTTEKDKGNRRAIWSIRKTKGYQTLYYRAVVRKKEKKTRPRVSEPELTKHQFNGPQFTAAQNILKQQ